MTKGRDADFQVVTFDRSPFTHEEKQVDVALSTTMMEDSFKCMKASNGDTAVLAAGTETSCRRSSRCRPVAYR